MCTSLKIKLLIDFMMGCKNEFGWKFGNGLCKNTASMIQKHAGLMEGFTLFCPNDIRNWLKFACFPPAFLVLSKMTKYNHALHLVWLCSAGFIRTKWTHSKHAYIHTSVCCQTVLFSTITLLFVFRGKKMKLT